MKIWVDDIRPAPNNDYIWIKSVNEFKKIVWFVEKIQESYYNFDQNKMNEIKDKKIITLIDLDHDAGEFALEGGDYINILNWLEETGRNYPIHIHSMNPVGVENMKRIIKKNGWKEIK